MNRSRIAEAGLALGVFLLVGLVFLAPLLGRFGSHILSGDGMVRPGTGDAFNFLWNYWWTQKALALGQSPYFCDWVLPPTGINLFFDTHLLVPTVASWPVAAVFGTTAGYNAMILAMLVGAALAFYVFARATFGLRPGPALLGGVFFGFSAYFLNKAHGHPNLIGGAFWAGTLGVLFHAWTRRDFSRGPSLALAGGVALVFWTSVVELFMTVLCGALVVGVFEVLRAGREPLAVRDKLLFLAPAAGVFAVSLAIFLAGGAEGFRPEIFARLALLDLFSFSRLSILHSVWTSETAEYGGVAFPIAGFVLAVIGLATRFLHREAVAILIAVLLVIALDVAGIPSRLVRSLPMAEGFRVFARFFPFLLLFAGVAFVAGAEKLLESSRGKVLLGVLLGLWAVEAYPAHLYPGPVKGARIAASELAALDESRYVLLFPAGPYLTSHDTYQVALDAPCVLTSTVAHRSAENEALRRREFPLLYDPDRRGSPAEFLSELRRLDVGYLLFESRRAWEASGLGGATSEWTGGEILVPVSSLAFQSR